MNKNTTQNEGMWDRFSAGWTGVQKAASNLIATAAGTPTKVTSVQDAKIKQLFNLTQSRMNPFVKNLKSNDIITKTQAESEVKKQLSQFFRDLMKITNEKISNNLIIKLQQPQYKNIADYLKKEVGMDLKKIAANIAINTPPVISTTSAAKIKKGTKYQGGKINAEFDGKQWINLTTNRPFKAIHQNGITQVYLNSLKLKRQSSATKKSGKLTKIKNPQHAAKFNGFVFDDVTKLWSDPKGNVLNTADSTTKTAEYIKAYNAGKIDKKGNLIPENINKITYKEFFV